MYAGPRCRQAHRWCRSRGACLQAPTRGTAAVLAARLRALVDGYMARAVARLSAWRSAWARSRSVSAAATTLLGSALATLAVGAWGHRVASSRLLSGAALLMAATGWLRLVSRRSGRCWCVAFVGTLNPSAGDVSVFLPLEHARLAAGAQRSTRARRCSRADASSGRCAPRSARWRPACLIGYGRQLALSTLDAMRVDVHAVRAIGVAVVAGCTAARARRAAGRAVGAPAAPLGPSRSIVVRLAALFSVDAFAGGLVVNSLLALVVCSASTSRSRRPALFFFWTGLLSAASQLRSAGGGAHASDCSTRWCSRTSRPTCCLLLARVGLEPAGCARAAVRPQRAVADGRADTLGLRDGGRRLRRARPRRRGLHRGAAKPAPRRSRRR